MEFRRWDWPQEVGQAGKATTVWAETEGPLLNPMKKSGLGSSTHSATLGSLLSCSLLIPKKRGPDQGAPVIRRAVSKGSDIDFLRSFGAETHRSPAAKVRGECSSAEFYQCGETLGNRVRHNASY